MKIVPGMKLYEVSGDKIEAAAFSRTYYTSMAEAKHALADKLEREAQSLVQRLEGTRALAAKARSDAWAEERKERGE